LQKRSAQAREALWLTLCYQKSYPNAKKSIMKRTAIYAYKTLIEGAFPNVDKYAYHYFGSQKKARQEKITEILDKI